MAALGSSTKGSLVFSDGKSVNLRTIFAMASLASKSANLMPTQPLGPCPNGMKAYLKVKHFSESLKQQRESKKSKKWCGRFDARCHLR